MSLGRHFLLTSSALSICLGAAGVTADEQLRLGEPLFEQGSTGLQPDNASPRSSTVATSYEQYMLELVNRARADPGAEASRLGIDLNQGLPAGTLVDTPKQPLAFHSALIDSSRAHSTWMLDNDVFSHTGVNGSSAGDRMTAAGYPFSGSWTWGENIAYKATTAPSFDQSAYTLDLHNNLFLSPGHRENILKDSFDEIGIGLINGDYDGYNSWMGTQNFAASGGTPGPLLTGVVYDDSNSNGFYDPGEGASGVTIRLSDGSETTTSATGGYALPYSGSGSQVATFFGGSVGAAINQNFVATGKNVKLDYLVSGAAAGFDLSVSVAGPGTVTSDPTGIACPSTCSAFYLASTSVTLTASPADNGQFTGWGGACSGTAASCTLTMNAAKTVLANFEDAAAAPSYENQVFTLFIGYFGRPPAPAGAEYYGGLMDQSSGQWQIIADDFWNSDESQGLYPPEQSTRVKINTIYRNLFSRDATSDGLDYWEGLINAGIISLPEAAYTIAYNASAEDLAILDAKRATALLWTNSLDTQDELAAFSTDAGLNQARSFLAGIDGATPASQGEVDQAIADMVASSAASAPNAF